MNTQKSLAWVVVVVLFVVVICTALYSGSEKAIVPKQNSAASDWVPVKEQPAIPKEYVTGKNLLDRMNNAAPLARDKVLTGVKSVSISYSIDDKLKDIISLDEIKPKIELTLRRSNVPISPDATTDFYVTVSAVMQDTPNGLLCYSIVCYVNESQWIFRDNGDDLTPKRWT